MQFNYQALDVQGHEVGGVLDAANEREAIRQLQRRELTVLELRGVQTRVRYAGGSRPKRRDVLIVLHELTTLLESGVSLIEAVESLGHSSHHPFLTRTFSDMAMQLRHGTTFSAALQQTELGLPWYIPQLVEAGELTGKLGQALRDGVEQMEYDERVRNEMRNALIYPSILVISGISAVLLIFTVVVPRFAGILQNKSEELPLLAQMVLVSGMFMHQYWPWVVGGLLGALLLLGYALSRPQGRARLRELLGRMPLLGEWVLEAETGRWAAMLGTLLENRVPLLRSLELAQQCLQLPALRARLSQVSKAVRAGTSLSQALSDHQALTSTGHNLIRAGERAGELPHMLRSLAKLYEESGRVRMKRFLLLLEPISILVIGGVIGFIITGVILAITSVNQVGF